MSLLEELLKKYCPDGVEYKTFSDTASYIRGVTYSKSKEVNNDNEKEYWEILRANNIDLYSNTLNFNDIKKISKDVKINKNQFLYANDIIICAGSGSKEHIGKVAFIDNDIPYSFGGFMGVIRANEDILLPRYLFHVLTSTIFKKHLNFNINSTTINNLSSQIMNILKIPLPPIEVQKEIVRILDEFTLNTTELQELLHKEYISRKKQYEYYRDKLLTFGDDVELQNFGDVCNIVTDYVAAGSFKDIAKNVEYIRSPDYAQLVRTTDIKNNFKNNDFVYINKKAFDYLYRVNLDKECIILPNIGINCGEVYYIKPELLPYKNNALAPNAILVRSDKTNNQFLSYLFKVNFFQKQLRKIISTAGQPKFNKTELKKIKIPVPPLEEQERIVKILDCFDALCNDISSGLPAEIEMRKKQYEYYRDKLLTFKEKKIKE